MIAASWSDWRREFPVISTQYSPFWRQPVSGSRAKLLIGKTNLATFPPPAVMAAIFQTKPYNKTTAYEAKICSTLALWYIIFF
jgi:hypothetical protein